MRIEISSGSIGSGASVMEFQSGFESFLSSADSVISCFKTIKNETCNLSGGVSSLQTALDYIDSRIQKEETARESATDAREKTSSFLSLAQRVDSQVAHDVKQNRDEFYSVNAWAKPAPSTEEKKWYERAWDWLCDRYEDVKNGFKAIGDTAKKVWNSIVDFYNEHKNLCRIIIGAFAIAIAVIVTVASGGAALPALLALTKAALMSGLISAAIGGTISAVSALAHGESLQSAIGTAVSSSVDGFCSGFMWGGIFSSATQIISVAKAGNAMTHAEQIASNRATGREYADEQFAKFAKANNNAAQEITLQTPSGVRTRVDQIGINSKGEVIIHEIKSSPTAPLTSNQSAAFPEIFEKGAMVKGLGKGIFTEGFQIPAGTEVKIIRSSFRYINFKELFRLPTIGGGVFGGWTTSLQTN